MQRALALHEPHVHQQEGHAGDMVRMEVSQDEIGHLVEVNANLTQTDYGVAHAVHHNCAFANQQHEVGVFVVFIGNCVSCA